MSMQASNDTKACESLAAATRTARGCAPDDAQGAEKLLRQLRELTSYLERSSRSDVAPACAVATQIAEQIHGQLDPTPAMLVPWVHSLLEYLCATLGVDADGKTKSSTPGPVRLASSEIADARERRSMSDGSRFGEIMVKMAYMKLQDVERAVELQRKKGCLLGEAMVDLGMLSRRGLEAALHMQRQTRKRDAWATGAKLDDLDSGSVRHKGA
jgi:hypothetical protein